MSFHWIDYAILGILGLFGLFGFIRGFTGRVLSLLSWGGAIAGSLKLSPLLRPWIDSFIHSSLGAILLAYGGIFLVLLILLKALTNAISQWVQKTPFKILDRILGLALSIFLGFIVLSVLAALLHIFLPSSYIAKDLKQSKLFPYILQGQNHVEEMNPFKGKQALGEWVSPSVLHDFSDKISNPSAYASSVEDAEYDPSERSALTALIQKNT